MKRVYQTHGDGRWFPGDGLALQDLASALLASASVTGGGCEIVAGIAPHAGYAYSGAAAAYTYRALQQAAQSGQGPETVVVLGFPHRATFQGLAWLDADRIQTPVGELPVDQDLMEQVASVLPGTFQDVDYHQDEHSAENQFPLLQVALPGIRVVAGLLGSRDPAYCSALAWALADASAERRICVIASTDLLHAPDYDRVVSSDARTLRMMESLDFEGLNEAWSPERQICCGIGPVMTALEVARKLGCSRGRRLFYNNSGDIAPSGCGEWVVGYGAVVFERGRLRT